MASLAVTITTCDNERTIRACVDSVRAVANRVVVVDSGSKDRTCEICESLGAEVIREPWRGFAAQKQFAIDQIQSEDWILLLDSDEILEPDLVRSIQRLLDDAPEEISGARFRRRHWYKGGYVHIEWGHTVARLFRRGRGRMISRVVHERLDIDGTIVRIGGVCRHESWTDVNDCFARNLKYAQFAGRSQAKSGSAWRVIFHPPWTFLRYYFFQGAFLDGWRGFELSCVLSMATMIKYLTAHEIQRTRHAEESAGHRSRSTDLE
ncbi:MAG: glycosyltransferase family 2 protein [Planctomycetota bacterium]|nr:glycosyltransferase family 2 protein [Planctomycetota bacterium]